VWQLARHHPDTETVGVECPASLCGDRLFVDVIPKHFAELSIIGRAADEEHLQRDRAARRWPAAAGCQLISQWIVDEHSRAEEPAAGRRDQDREEGQEPAGDRRR
jgi:hypothetical protein